MKLKVSHVLETKNNDIWWIRPNATAFNALEIMAEKDIGALLVLDNEKLVGIFSERDYARKVILKGRSSKETSVGELMNREVFSISPKKSIQECMSLMTSTRGRHIPVIEDGKLIGVVSIGDVVNAIITTQKVEIEDLKNYGSIGRYSSEWTAS
jgi:signal-transduction protein with cAMP-binding, CBS, and nucleotidyltransferase domain